jgi:hypothetical protein
VGVDNAVRYTSLYLTGDMRLECGTFNDRDLPIRFNGFDHTLYWDNTLCKVTGNSLDNIILLANSVTYLSARVPGAKIVMDNIEMQDSSELHLNGFNLYADGKSWVSDLVPTTGVDYEFGKIFGTLAIPEPGTLLLLGTGAIAALGHLRRRRMK